MRTRRTVAAPTVLFLVLAPTVTTTVAAEGWKLSHTPIDEVVVFQDSISKSTPARIRNPVEEQGHRRIAFTGMEVVRRDWTAHLGLDFDRVGSDDAQLRLF